MSSLAAKLELAGSRRQHVPLHLAVQQVCDNELGMFRVFRMCDPRLSLGAMVEVVRINLADALLARRTQWPRRDWFNSIRLRRSGRLLAAWDDLWQRSDVALPNARAELVAQWLETAAPRASVRALAVEQDGQFVAALPLLGGRIKRLLSVGRLPTNDWSWAGDLLVDPSADVGSGDGDAGRSGRAIAVAHCFGWRGSRWSRPAGRHFAAALEAMGLAVDTRERFRVGQIEIDQNWAAYKAKWSGNHRHQDAADGEPGEKRRGLEADVLRDVPQDQIESLLRRGFEVECRSWKGDGGNCRVEVAANLRFLLPSSAPVGRVGPVAIDVSGTRRPPDCVRIWLERQRRLLLAEGRLRRRIPATHARAIASARVAPAIFRRSRADGCSISSARCPTRPPNGSPARIRSAGSSSARNAAAAGRSSGCCGSIGRGRRGTLPSVRMHERRNRFR